MRRLEHLGGDKAKNITQYSWCEKELETEQSPNKVRLDKERKQIPRSKHFRGGFWTYGFGQGRADITYDSPRYSFDVFMLLQTELQKCPVSMGQVIEVFQCEVRVQRDLKCGSQNGEIIDRSADLEILEWKKLRRSQKIFKRIPYILQKRYLLDYDWLT